MDEPNEVKSEPAAQPVTIHEALSRMQAHGGTLTATVTVTRAATGKTETHTLVMTPVKE